MTHCPRKDSWLMENPCNEYGIDQTGRKLR